MQNEYDEAVEALDKKLEEMWERLDGTYHVMGHKPGDAFSIGKGIKE